MKTISTSLLLGVVEVTISTSGLLTVTSIGLHNNTRAVDTRTHARTHPRAHARAHDYISTRVLAHKHIHTQEHAMLTDAHFHAPTRTHIRIRSHTLHARTQARTPASTHAPARAQAHTMKCQSGNESPNQSLISTYKHVLSTPVERPAS